MGWKGTGTWYWYISPGSERGRCETFEQARRAAVRAVMMARL